MFSSQIIQKTHSAFARFLNDAGKALAEKIQTGFEENQCSDLVRFFVEWQYANLPLSDAASYDFSLFFKTARHSVFLYSDSPYTKALSEEDFLIYVLSPRVNDEELCVCRAFFYDTLKERIRGLSFEEAVKEINYFCAENVRYVSTDERTRSALATFESGFGRCGEESVFCVNALRACGIAARQVYAPRWAHCDDNHAWVEVFDADGQKWHFLGACEPEETLDRGWFCAAASRAPLIYARLFCDPPFQEALGKSGMVRFESALETYALATFVQIFVKDEAGNPVQSAKICVKILNYAHFATVLTLVSDESGRAKLSCGKGSVFVCARKGELYAEEIVDLRNVTRIELCLKKNFFKEDTRTFCFFAPKGEKTLARAASKSAPAREKRERVEARYREKMAQRNARKAEAYEQFFEDPAFSRGEKEKLFAVLCEKDREDLKKEVLLDALNRSKPYRNIFGDEDLFYRFLVCPRISNEVLTPFRQGIEAYFSNAQKQLFQADPQRIHKYIEENILEIGGRCYGELTTFPLAALKFKRADRKTKEILFVAICRTLGIPARLDFKTGETEYFRDGKFQSVHKTPRGEVSFDFTSGLVFGKDLSLSRVDFENETLLELSNGLFQNGKALSLPCGVYRLVSAFRLPSGNTMFHQTVFRLKEGESVRLAPERPQAELSDMLFSIPLNLEQELFPKKEESGALLLLRPGEEPTEHLLSELLSQREEVLALSNRIVFSFSQNEGKSGKIEEALKAFPALRHVEIGEEETEFLARSLYLEPDRFPIAVLFRPFPTAVFAFGGYNVGSVDLILKLLNDLK